MGSVHTDIVHDKISNDVERLCSHVTAAATHHAPPAANEGRHPKHCPSNSHLHPTTTDAPTPAGPRTELWPASSRECSRLHGSNERFPSYFLLLSSFP